MVNSMTNDAASGVPSERLEDQVAHLTAQVKQLAAQREAEAQPDALTAEELAAKYHLLPEHLEAGAPAINAAAHVAAQKAREAIRTEVTGLRQEFEQKTETALEDVFQADMARLAPGWPAINATPEFNDWLKATGKYAELREARDAYSAAGCAQVFKDYVAAKAKLDGQRHADWDVPGGAQNSMLPRQVPDQPTGDIPGPVYSTDQVLLFLDEYAKGLHPTVEDAKTFREINKAVQEGRVK